MYPPRCPVIQSLDYFYACKKEKKKNTRRYDRGKAKPKRNASDLTSAAECPRARWVTRYLDLAGLWAAEALLHLLHGRVAGDVLLQRGRRGEHLMQVAWRGTEEEEEESERRRERGGDREESGGGG